MIYEVNNLNFSYNKKENILSNISFKLDEGELVTVLGKNGIGKSTLFSLLMGFNKPDSGEIKLCGKNILDLKEREIAKLVGYVPQTNNLVFNISVFDYVLMGLSPNINIFSKPGKIEKEMALIALEIMNITHLKDRGFNELSGGEKEQVLISRAISNNPKVLIFDEPTSHLDIDNQIKVLKMVKDLSNKGFSILISTHDPNHSILLDGNCLIFDNKGKVIKGTSKEIVNSSNLKNVYDIDLEVKYLEDLDRNICLFPNIK